jgi:hypothetical protein
MFPEIKIMCTKCWNKRDPKPAYYTYAEQIFATRMCNFCHDITNDFKHVAADEAEENNEEVPTS